MVSVGGLEVCGEMTGSGFGGGRAEGLVEDVGGEVEVAGADEEEVCGLGVEDGFGVAEEADGADVKAVLREDGADEGGEVGGAVDEEDAAAAGGCWLGGGGGFLEGGEGFVVGGQRFQDSREEGLVEEAGDESRGGGEAEVAPALAEGGHVADDEAEAHAVEAMDVREVEDDAGGGVGAAVEEGFEGGGFGAEGDGAVAVDRVDVVGEFGGEV